MAYGRGEYGQRGYGGSSFEQGGPQLVSSDPPNLDTGVAEDATVTIDLDSPAGLDLNTLSVEFDGTQVIVGGLFQTGYGGTISQDPETDSTVVISTHPNFPSGSLTVDISLSDLAGNSATPSFSFSVGAEEFVGDTLSLSEGLTAQQENIPTTSESLSLSEGLATQQDGLATAPESLSISEGLTAQQESIPTTSESLSLSEGLVTQQDGLATAPESLSISEGLATQQDFTVEVSESLSTSDAVLLGTEVEVSDTLSLSDNVSSQQDQNAGVSEVLSSSDGVEVQRDLDAEVAESLGIIETLDISGTTNVSEALSLTEQLSLSASHVTAVGESLSLGESLSVSQNSTIDAIESLSLGEAASQDITATITVVESLSVSEQASPDTFRVSTGGDGRQLSVYFSREARFDGVTSLQRYSVRPSPGSAGVPVRLKSVEPLYESLQSGQNAAVVASSDPVTSDRIQIEGTLDAVDSVGTYLQISSGQNTGLYRIVSVLQESPGIAVVDRPLFLLDYPSVYEWEQFSAVLGVQFVTSKFTNLGDYDFSAQGLLSSDGDPFNDRGQFKAQGIPSPKLVGVEFQDDSSLIVEFDDLMRRDASLTNPGDYDVSGPEDVRVLRVKTLDDNRVRLDLSGILAGTYTLSVSSSTPKDVAGNPIDPTFNQAVFTSSTPLNIRSVFVDNGPIAKPPLTLQTGTGATVQSFTEVSFPGASFTSAAVGQYVTLSGGSINGGTFQVIGFIDSETLKFQASFTLPDTASLDWELFDPRNGEIADDPSDVEVRVNGSPVTVDAVSGLLGQIVLSSAPASGSDVKVDYSFCCNPVVEIRRLNSKEFRLNSWNRDRGYLNDGRQHNYRYNNVLVSPSDFDVLDPRAKLAAPKQRDLKYRAYERAYTPVLNDPNLLTLNCPTHRIAYPPARRILTEMFVQYEANVLPENNGWTRVGTGVASTLAGILTVEDDSSGTFPNGQTIFWTREVDLTFQHVFAASWRFSLDLVTEADGVFTGVAAGYSDESVAVVVGFLEVGGTKQVGLLKRGATDPGDVLSWTGGLDTNGDPTLAPADFDWDTTHSYRLFRDLTGLYRLYADGDVVATLQAETADLPPLESVPAPFDAIQGVFFGSVSRPARSTSSWDFVRYLILPTNSQQTSPSSFVSYEANVLPESDPKPWTLAGASGFEEILDTDFLLLASTSASDASGTGTVTGDFRGYARIEPLLQESSQVVLDVQLTGTSHTHGVDPDGLMFAVDDGTRLLQVSFLSDVSAPKISYGGRSLPEDFSPFAWGKLGGETSGMAGRLLRITDATVGDGLVYFYEDAFASTSPERVVASSHDYTLECRMTVLSYTVDGSGFAGAFAQAFDGLRLVGLQLAEVSGVRYVQLMSDGTSLAQFAFEWNDGAAHTYRLRKNTSGDLVTLLVDGTLVGSLAYSSFTAAGPSTTGLISFGSSTAASADSLSVVDWDHCNAVRILSSQRRYVGLWRGYDGDSLTGYHLPTKASGRNATVTGNVLGDTEATFLTNNVVTGDLLVVDVGPNKGVYEVASVPGQSQVTILGTWPSGPSLVDYRIVRETDWSTQHKYRLYRDSTGDVSLFLDAETDPLFQINVSPASIPSSSVGISQVLSGGLPSVVFGSFSGSELAQSLWDFVRYGITKSPTEQRIAPHHQVLNQWNVMHSAERLRTLIPHDLADFKSSSTGIVPKKDPDLFENTGLVATTLLNQGTPLVPSTQTSEVRSAASPFPTQEFISSLNSPEDVLNNDGDFTLNDGSIRYRLMVPDDVLYNSLDVIESSTGEDDLIRPFDDECGATITGLAYQNQVCLDYEGDVLPENDTAAPTLWELVSDNPSQVSASVFGGILSYGTGIIGTRTAYRNNTPLLDAPSLSNVATFRLRVAQDSTLGTDDSQIRLGFSAPGLTIALAFVTHPVTAERFVLVLDLRNGAILGSITFDFLDGAYHTYQLHRDPTAGEVRISIDS